MKADPGRHCNHGITVEEAATHDAANVGAFSI
jgi:hypothetical protein